MKKIVILTLIIVAGVFSYRIFDNLKQDVPKNMESPTTSEQLKLISTKPEPLEGATILPTDYIELTFNKPLVKSELKHSFDPEVEHEVEAVNGKNDSTSNVFRLKFKKPLELGSGYTLFINGNTKSEDNFNIEKEYVFHFSTIKYKGI